MIHHNIEVIHCHGSENYFLLIDAFSSKLNFTEVDFKRFTLSAIKHMSGLKIDGVLFLLASAKADARMRIFNKDGSEAEMCGNGYRCIAKKLHQITGQKQFKIETLSGLIKGEKKPDIFPNIDTFSVLFDHIDFNYGKISFQEKVIPELDPELKFSTIDIGNPHLIAEVKDFEIEKLKKLGEKINHNCHIFPKGNNLSFYKILNKQEIYVMTYERGVGLTNSCGTAMAATTLLLAHLKKIAFNQPIQVKNKGGMVVCVPKSETNFSVELIGNASFVQGFSLKYDAKNAAIESIRQTFFNQNEINNYFKFKNFLIQDNQ